MKILKKIMIICLVMVLGVSASVFYAFKIEPYRIKINEYMLNERESDMSFLKIVQISDLHIKEDFTYENLSKIVNNINRQAPDIVLFTGDLYDNYAKYRDDENVISELKRIKSGYGKIAIWGNRDYGGGAVRQYEAIMGSAGVQVLKNENLFFTVNNGKKILFTGLDDSLLGHPYMPDSTKKYNADFKVLLMHEPDVIEEYLDYNYDITFSGHSHGGQMNVPFLPFINEKAVTVTALSSVYSGGMYELEGEQMRRLYVNTGIGTTHISARFGVVPEIAVFNIYL